MIEQAVILAAGRGARLRCWDDGPKPLTEVCGLSLVKRALLVLQREGVRRAVVVVGYRGDEIQRVLEADADLTAELIFVTNPQWELSNGLSVLAARGAVEGEFLLTMADHVFDGSLVRLLQRAGAPAGGVTLAVDREIDGVFDLPDATKVATEGHRIVEIGKRLQHYDAIDTGLFACSAGIFEALDAVQRESGDASLTQGVERLARDGRAQAVEIRGSMWQDVDTPDSLREAERRLLQSLRKPVDGIVARHLNRHISLAITRRLCRTRIRPNHVTAFTLAVGVAAAVLVAMGDYLSAALGAFLFQWNSILDGVDGELARLKFQGSRLGEWLDTVADDLTNVLFYAGIAVGAHRMTGDVIYLYLGAAAVGLSISCSALMYYWIWTRERSGDLLKFRWFFESAPGGEGALSSAPASSGWLSKLKYLSKQDFFVLLFFGLALGGALPVALYLVCLAGVFVLTALTLQYVRESRGRRTGAGGSAGTLRAGAILSMGEPTDASLGAGPPKGGLPS